MKILFIINPVSGADSNDKAILLIHQKAAALGTDFKFLYTSSGNDNDSIQRQLTEYKPTLVVACGGDGTVQIVASNLMNKNIPMGILPLGSANGLATALKLPLKLPEAVDLIFSGKETIPLDLLKFNDRHLCTHLADIGVNARMVKNYAEGGDRGMIGYAKHLIESIKESPLLTYKIVINNETIEKAGYMVAFANANMYGTGVRISEGSVSDGKFEICNVERIALEDAIKAGLTKFNVFVDKDMFSDVISCHEAEIFIDQKIDFQIDGEYMGEVDHITISIFPSAVPVLIN